MGFVVQNFSGTIGELKLRIKFRMLVFQLFEGDTSIVRIVWCPPLSEYWKEFPAFVFGILGFYAALRSFSVGNISANLEVLDRISVAKCQAFGSACS